MVNITDSTVENNVDINATENTQTIDVTQEPDQIIGIEGAESNQDVLVIQEEDSQDINVETPTGGVGLRGYSAYEIAVQNGFKGTEQEWLKSLEGEDGSTPYIKDGYWYIDEINTNVKAEGEKGERGDRGEKGEQGIQGAQGVQGIQGIQGEQGIPGVKGDKGDKGDGFSIAKTYPSVAAMNEGYTTDGVPLNGFVLINTGNVSDEDNAKLFVKLENGYSYLTDLSGAQGIQGEKGEKGEQGPQGEKGIQGEQGIQGEKGDPYILNNNDKLSIAETVEREIEIWRYQPKEDNTLETESKEVVGAINELLSNITGNAWIMYDDLEGANDFTFDFNFVSNGIAFTQMLVSYYEEDDGTAYTFVQYRNLDTQTVRMVYNEQFGGWEDSTYKTIYTDNIDISLDDIATKIPTALFERLTTEAKTVVGAINEVNEKIVENADSFEEQVKETTFGKWISNFVGNATDFITALIAKIKDVVKTEEVAELENEDEARSPNTVVGAIQKANRRATAIENGTTKVGASTKADKLSTARKITFTGDVSGEMTFDGSKDESVNLSVLGGGTGGKDGLSTYLYNGVFVTPLALKPIITAVDIADITIPSGREIQVGDFLIDTEGTLASVSGIAENLVYYKVEMSLKGEGGDTSNLATLDKIYTLDTWGGETEELYAEDTGINWTQQAVFLKDDGEEMSRAFIALQVPIVAGDGIEFEQDEENPVIKINAQNTIDKIYYMEQDQRVDSVAARDFGLFWQVGGRMMDEDDNALAEYSCDQNAPIVAGNGIEFEVDEENRVVKINATGGGTEGGDTSNLATVDKIYSIGTWMGETEELYAEDTGINWSQQAAFFNEDGEDMSRPYIALQVPIVAGDGIEFEQDEENPVIKINAISDSVVGTWVLNDVLTITSDMNATVNFIGYDADGIEREFKYFHVTVIESDGYMATDYSVEYEDDDGNYYMVCDTTDTMWNNEASKNITITAQPNEKEFRTWLKANGTKQVEEPPYMKKIKVELTGGEMVTDIINKMVDAGYQFGAFGFVEFTGARSALYGLTINHYGGNVYNIGGIDFGTFYTMANNVRDWSTVYLWSFSGYFQPPIPYCDDANNGQVLKVVNGVPTWTDL